MHSNHYLYNSNLYTLQSEILLNSNTNAEEPEATLSYDSEGSGIPQKRTRRKIKIEYIHDKPRRHITFSKRKSGIMKKAYELSTLTGTQVLLLVVSETGLVYTFTTPKLQPIISQPEGKKLIQTCLNTSDPIELKASNQSPSNTNLTEKNNMASYQTTIKGNYEELKVLPQNFNQNNTTENTVSAVNSPLLSRDSQQQIDTSYSPSKIYSTYPENNNSMYQYNLQSDQIY